MATKKIKNSELVQARNAAQAYINQNPLRTRFHYGLEKFLARTKSHHERFVDEENDLRVDHAALEGPEKNQTLKYETIPGRPGQPPSKILSVAADKAKALQKALRKLENEEVDIEPFFVKAESIPTDLEAGWYQVFVGIVIEKDPFEEKEATPEMVVN